MRTFEAVRLDALPLGDFPYTLGASQCNTPARPIEALACPHSPGLRLLLRYGGPNCVALLRAQVVLFVDPLVASIHCHQERICSTPP